MRLFRPSFIARFLYPEAIFRIKTKEKVLFLTFDDGPDPESTPGLIAQLAEYEVKAIFFNDGRAAGKYPELVEIIRSNGHIPGNHCYSHPDGWRTSAREYVEDVSKAAELTKSKFFRPPFGHMKFSQYRKLKEAYKIVLWDIMPYDFDKKMSADRSLDVMKRKMRPGSIIVLHDKPASSANKIVGEFIKYAIGSGYRFDVLPQE